LGRRRAPRDLTEEWQQFLSENPTIGQAKQITWGTAVAWIMVLKKNHVTIASDNRMLF
jgi:hypothetical protein